MVGCPLAVMKRDMINIAHVDNLKHSMKRPLYMECECNVLTAMPHSCTTIDVLGHPFGKVPPSKPFEYDGKDGQVIITDPCNPLGKELLSGNHGNCNCNLRQYTLALGYSTKVYFNACCSPSPLFDKDKVLHNLPLSLGPSHIAPSLRAVLQLLVDLCIDSEYGLSLIPEGTGPTISAKTKTGKTMTKSISAPSKLSQYWMQIYDYSTIFKCCENFLSATIPSAPCLLCHSFGESLSALWLMALYLLESFAENLHIKETDSPPSCSALDASSCSRVKEEGEVCISEVISHPNHDGIQYVAYTEPLCNDTPTTTTDTPTTVNDTSTTPEHDNGHNTTTPRRSSRNRTKM